MSFIDLHCHILWDLDDGCQSPEETLAAARALLERERVPLRLHAGGENLIDGDFLGALAAGATRRLGDGARYALVEVPFLAPAPMLPVVMRRMAAAGVAPILAHPER